MPIYPATYRECLEPQESCGPAPLTAQCSDYVPDNTNTDGHKDIWVNFKAPFLLIDTELSYEVVLGEVIEVESLEVTIGESIIL